LSFEQDAASKAVALVLLSTLSLSTRVAEAAEPGPVCASESEVEAIRAAAEREARSKALRSGLGPEIERTPRFLVVYDQELRLFAPPWSSPEAHARALALAEEAWFAAGGDGIRALVTFTVFDPGPSDLFYLPVANDVLGLGVGTAAAVFDDRPESMLEGLIFLGEPRQLIGAGEDYFREAFLHELAHRWLAYAQISHPELEPDALRGRQSAHWSYFIDSGSSPMEGNDWQETEAGVFRTQLQTPKQLYFSPLDLYLMGLLAADEVPSFQLLRPIEVLSPANTNIDRESAPARRSGAEVTLRADPVEVRIEHLILGSGPRHPGPDMAPAPTTWPIGVVVLSRGRTLSPVDRAALADLEKRLERLALDFEEATQGRMRLDLAVRDAASTPLFGQCESASACNLAQADRCEGLIAGRHFCTRACTEDTECGSGVCCPRVAFCTPIGTCSEFPAPPVEATDGGLDADGAKTEDPPDDEASSCRATPGSGSTGLLLLIAIRLGLRRRRPRGNPERARRPHLPDRGNPEAA
jgi:hypothetical protein